MKQKVISVRFVWNFPSYTLEKKHKIIFPPSVPEKLISMLPLKTFFFLLNLPFPSGKNRSSRPPSPWKLQWLSVRWCGTLICWNHTIMYCNHSFYCRLTSPLLLIALSVAGGGCLFISYKNQGKKIQVLGGKLLLIGNSNLWCNLLHA